VCSSDLSKYITCEEYEDCYRETLLLLKERYEHVGKPYQLDGQRVCSIKTGLFDQPLILEDRRVFLLGWGQSVAEKFEQRVSRSTISPL